MHKKIVLHATLFLSFYQQELQATDPGAAIGIAIIASTGYAVLRTGEWCAYRLFGSNNPVPSISYTSQTNHINVSGHSTVHLKNSSAHVQPANSTSSGSNHLYEGFSHIPFKKYGVTGLGAAATGYLYIVYLITQLQQNLTRKECISLWFNEYEFNNFLLLEPHLVQELIVQEFITVYNVHDQKSLKDGIYRFIKDLESELHYLQKYQVVFQRLDAVSKLSGKFSSACSSVMRVCVPLSGLLLDYAPQVGLNSLFFVNTALKNSISERISRLYYYKNIFLQSDLVI